MSRPCKEHHCQIFWYQYKEDCDIKLRTKTRKIEELEIKVKKLKAESVEAHNNWVDERERSQELLIQKNAADAKTQQLENEARHKITRII